MLKTDALTPLAKAVAPLRNEARDGRAWDEASVRLAAGVLQRAFGLDDVARNTFLDLAHREERMQAAERWRGR